VYSFPRYYFGRSLLVPEYYNDARRSWTRASLPLFLRPKQQQPSCIKEAQLTTLVISHLATYLNHPTHINHYGTQRSRRRWSSQNSNPRIKGDIRTILESFHPDVWWDLWRQIQQKAARDAIHTDESDSRIRRGEQGKYCAEWRGRQERPVESVSRGELNLIVEAAF